MSTTIKVFIILNLLLALAFTWISMTLYATRENWKRRWNEDTTELSKQLKTAEQEVADESFNRRRAENMVSNLEGDLNTAQALVKKQESDLTERAKEIAGKDLQISKLQADIAGLMEDNRTLSTTLEGIRQRNNELTHIAQVAKAVTFQLNVKLAETEDDLNNATTELTQREEDLTALGKKLKDYEAKLAIVKDRHPAIFNEIMDEKSSAKFLQGVVAAVKNNPQGQQDLVMLTIGKEEAVEEGMEFIVFRGNQYVVKVRAEKVMSDMVACRVIPASWNAKDLKIQPGDLAQNRL